MRRALREQLPALTRFYGLAPWDVERLTFGELDAYIVWMNDYLEAQKGGR